jgi:hypothetical protein
MFTGMFISAVALTYATPMTNVGLIVTVTLLSLTNVTVGLNTLLFGWGAGGGGDGGFPQLSLPLITSVVIDSIASSENACVTKLRVTAAPLDDGLAVIAREEYAV